MDDTKEIHITTEYITLGQFLKFADIIHEGGEAKRFLAENEILVNGEAEARRGKKLRPGDYAELDGKTYMVTAE